MDSVTSNSGIALAKALINSSKIPLLMFDGQLRVIAASWSFCATFDLTREHLEGRALDDLGTGEWGIPQLRTLLEIGLTAESGVVDYEADLIRPNRLSRQLMLNVQRVQYEKTAEPRVILTIEDVTELRKAQRDAATLSNDKDTLLQERATLLLEMQHRVANSLQIVASVLLLKARTVKSEEIRAHLQDAHARVMSVASVQDHLQDVLGDVDVASYLAKLCGSLSASMIANSGQLKLTVRADPSSITSHDAVSLGLIVTELVINSLKHAFPEDRKGSISVDYQTNAEGWSLSVTDDGVGRRATMGPKTKAGLGTSLVTALAHQLDARVEISDAGPGARVVVIHDVALMVSPTLAA